jgi:hypothetical protein
MLLPRQKQHFSSLRPMTGVKFFVVVDSKARLCDQMSVWLRVQTARGEEENRLSGNSWKTIRTQIQ